MTLRDLLASVEDPRALTIEASLFLVLFLVGWWVLRAMQEEPAAKRVGAVLGRLRASEDQRDEVVRQSLGSRLSAWSFRLTKRLKLQDSARDELLQDRLVRAGLRQPSYRYVFLATQIVLPPLLAAVASVYVMLRPGWQPVQVMLAAVLGLCLGYFAPIVYVKNLAAKRRQALQRSIPDGLDLLVVCTEAGLSMDAAFNRVAAELGPAAPELADELALTAVELNFLPERRQALINLGKRTDIPAFTSVVSTLVQSERYGTPLSQSLRVLSSEFRDHRMLAAEEKAARLPATLTVPMIVFILPTLFIVLLGPAFLQISDTFGKH